MSQSIELYLKAFIIAAGGKQSELKKPDTRHSLLKLFEMATAKGYAPRSAKTAAVIELLAPHHSDHSFRYRKVGFKTYPTLRESLETSDRMDREIASTVARSIPKLDGKNAQQSGSFEPSYEQSDFIRHFRVGDRGRSRCTQRL
jgi:hypothetical protein